MLTLEKYGAACRCLLRIRENGGAPGMSDTTFVRRFASRYPDWLERPGVTDIVRMGEVARELGLAQRIEVYRDYDQILQAHRDGLAILVCTDRLPQQRDWAVAPGRHVLLVVAMDEKSFSLWWPQPNGQSDTLPLAARAWWDQWQAIGVVLFPDASAPSGQVATTRSAP